jgi:hypothetical protein
MAGFRRWARHELVQLEVVMILFCRFIDLESRAACFVRNAIVTSSIYQYRESICLTRRPPKTVLKFSTTNYRHGSRSSLP